MSIRRKRGIQLGRVLGVYRSDYPCVALPLSLPFLWFPRGPGSTPPRTRREPLWLRPTPLRTWPSCRRPQPDFETERRQQHPRPPVHRRPGDQPARSGRHRDHLVAHAGFGRQPRYDSQPPSRIRARRLLQTPSTDSRSASMEQLCPSPTTRGCPNIQARASPSPQTADPPPGRGQQPPAATPCTPSSTTSTASPAKRTKATTASNVC